MAYIVIKTIRGRRYKYWQRAWREGSRVRTQCRCLGRIDGEEAATRDGTNGNTTKTRAVEAWRNELNDGLREVRRRLEQQGNHYIAGQIEAIDADRLQRGAVRCSSGCDKSRKIGTATVTPVNI